MLLLSTSFFMTLMRFDMLRKIIGTRECLVASGIRTCEWAFQCMYTHMAFKMFESLETSLALHYRAHVGFLLLRFIIMATTSSTLSTSLFTSSSSNLG